MKHLIKVTAALLVLIACTAAAQTTAITGATVHTVGPDGTLENATIIIDGGRITDVGTNVSIPANAEQIDASGKIITPGFFSPIGQIGLSEHELYLPHSIGIQALDRYQISSTEYYMIETIKKRGPTQSIHPHKRFRFNSKHDPDGITPPRKL